jgi:hypothetical protein
MIKLEKRSQNLTSELRREVGNSEEEDEKDRKTTETYGRFST